MLVPWTVLVAVKMDGDILKIYLGGLIDGLDVVEG